MKSRKQGNSTWIDIVTGIVSKSDGQHTPEERLDDRCVRAHIVSRTRWVMLVAVALYALIAAISFSFSSLGFHFASHQVIFLSLTVVSVVFYNYLLSSNCSFLSRLPYLVHLQIGLDLFFVTVLIHFTGGVFSWFWPVYLLVTFESAFLFEDKRDVWLIGTLGATFYGALLIAESVHLIPAVPMPFVDSSQNKVFLFQMLMWCWVAGINATVAIIAAFLMGTIRKDKLRVKESEEALLGFITSANDLIFSVDSDGIILYANQTFITLLSGEHAENIYSRNLYDLVNSDARLQLADMVTSVLQSSHPAHIDVSFTTSEKHSVDVEMSLTSGVRGGEFIDRLGGLPGYYRA